MAYPGPHYVRKTEGPTSLEIGRERDEEIEEIEGPFWSELLVLYDLFTNRKSANHRIRVLFKKRKIYFLGRCSPHPGKHPLFIYGSQKVKDDNLEHEVHLSNMLAPYYRDGASIRRLYNFNRRLRPDAEMTMRNGMTYWWEYHTGSVSTQKLRDRFKLYEEFSGPILFVCRRTSQFPKVWRAGETLKDRLYVASLDDVVRDPYGDIWTAGDGGKAGLEPRDQGRDEGGDQP